jgi:hypothetical protein
MMTTILNYAAAFWSVVVINCIQPVNWQYCYRVDQWLVPELHEGWKLYIGEIVPYQTEKEYLKSIKD